MTIPVDGDELFSVMCAEFGLNPATAVFPRDFYGKGGAPAAGELKFSDFRGRSAGGNTGGGGTGGVTFNPDPGYYNAGSTQTSLKSFVINASAPVVWNFSIEGRGITATRANGSSGTQLILNGAKLSSGVVTVNAGGQEWSIEFGDGGVSTL